MVGRQSGSAEALCDLERYLASAQEKHLGLPEVEAESVRRGREVVRLALQDHLDARGNGDVGAAITVEGPDGPLRLAYKRAHTRRIVSLVAELRVTRMGYAAPGLVSIHPLDAELCLPSRSFSYNYQRHLVRAAICGPFDEAVHFLAEMTGVVVPKRSAEQIVAAAAVDFDSFYAQRAGKANLGPEDILVGAIDCKGIPMVKPARADKVVRRRSGEKPNKKKMATVAAVFSAAPRPRTPASVVASLFAEGPAHADHRRGIGTSRDGRTSHGGSARSSKVYRTRPRRWWTLVNGYQQRPATRAPISSCASRSKTVQAFHEFHLPCQVPWTPRTARRFHLELDLVPLEPDQLFVVRRGVHRNGSSSDSRQRLVLCVERRAS